MKIAKITIENVTSFKDKCQVELGDFNVFIGKNGSGKSNLMKTAYNVLNSIYGQYSQLIPFENRLVPQSVVETVVNIDKTEIKEISEGSAYITLFNQDHLKDYLTAFKGQSSLSFLKKQILSNNHMTQETEFSGMSLIGSDVIRYLGPFFSSVVSVIRRKIIIVPDTRDVPSNFQFNRQNADPISLNNFMEFLTSLKLNKRGDYDKLVLLYKRILPSTKDVLIDIRGSMGQVSMSEENMKYVIPISNVSKGTRELLILLSILLSCEEGSSIFIEEPEIHLHKSAVKELKNIFLELIQEKNLQITITTHNPLFLDGMEPELNKSARLYKFTKMEDSNSRITEIIEDKDFEKVVFELG